MKYIVKGVGIGIVGAAYVWLYGVASHGHEGLFVFGSLLAVMAVSQRRGAQK